MPEYLNAKFFKVSWMKSSIFNIYVGVLRQPCWPYNDPKIERILKTTYEISDQKYSTSEILGRILLFIILSDLSSTSNWYDWTVHRNASYVVDKQNEYYNNDNSFSQEQMFGL